MEYQVWWRYSDDHSPDGWVPIGKPTQDLTILIEILAPEDYKFGMEWQGMSYAKPSFNSTVLHPANTVNYKIMQRTVTLSDFRDLYVTK